MNASHLEGHLPADATLSPRWQFERLSLLGRCLSTYPQDDLWTHDTRLLPGPLRAIRKRAKAFADEQIAPLSATLDLAEHLPAGQLHPQARHLLAEAGRAGWLSYFLPRPLGSMPLLAGRYPPIWQASLVVEEFSRACGGLMLLLSAHHLGAMPLILSGSLGTLRRYLLPAYRQCEAGDPHLIAFAITEPGAGSDVEEGHGAQQYRPGLVARRSAGGWLLRGRKCFISGGDIARSMTVFAALEGEGMESWTCFHVSSAAPGFRVARTELKMGMRASGAAELEFNDVFVPDAAVVGGLRQGWALNRATLNASRIPVAAMGVGLARAASEAALAFARSYRLGGRRLIDYQEVQLQLATLLGETRALRGMVWHEARAGWKPRQLNAAACKFQATDRAQKVCEMAMDLLAEHGGLHRNRVERTLRDVRLTRIFEGTNQINRLAVIEDWQPQLLAPSTHPVGV
jgi:alkylation response protein AidB-like acyl-CoA dehydrogenase